MSMRGKIQFDQLGFEVEASQHGEQIRVAIGTQEFLAHLQETPQGFKVRVGEVLLSLDIPKEQKDEMRLSRSTPVSIDGQIHQVRFTPMRAQRKAQSSANLGSGEGSVTAFMPGTIVRVMVEVGQHVQAGDVLLILEAMKMENEVKSPQDGVIKTLQVTAGTNVNKGQVLVEIEAPSPNDSAET